MVTRPVPVPGVDLHVGPFDRLARGGVEHEPAEDGRRCSAAGPPGPACWPRRPCSETTLFAAPKRRVVAGQEVIEAGLQVLGRGEVLDPLLVVFRRRQVGRPGQVGLRWPGSPCAARRRAIRRGSGRSSSGPASPRGPGGSRPSSGCDRCTRIEGDGSFQTRSVMTLADLASICFTRL